MKFRFKNRFKKNKSTREGIGARNIDDLGVETYEGEKLVYFLIQPDNIAVLSETAVRSRIVHLKAIIKAIDGVELSCINSRENFDSNKRFFEKRLAEETEEQVRELLRLELQHLDRVQIQTASARAFLLTLRFRNYDPDSNSVSILLRKTASPPDFFPVHEVQTGISRMEKLLKDNGFSAKLADKEELKRIYAVYFVQNITQVYFDDYDGQSFVKGGDFS